MRMSLGLSARRDDPSTPGCPGSPRSSQGFGMGSKTLFLNGTLGAPDAAPIPAPAAYSVIPPAPPLAVPTPVTKAEPPAPPGTVSAGGGRVALPTPTAKVPPTAPNAPMARPDGADSTAGVNLLRSTCVSLSSSSCCTFGSDGNSSRATSRTCARTNGCDR